MNLNIGSSNHHGIYKHKEWINLDIIKVRGVNVVASGYSLPFKDNSIKEIHAAHVLEHLTRDKIPLMIEECARVISPGNPCFIEVPDFRNLVKLLHQAFETGDKEQQHIWRTSVYGKTERKGMAHHFGFDEDLLKEMMIEAGFNKVKRLTERSQMITPHFKYEPIILMKGTK